MKINSITTPVQRKQNNAQVSIFVLFLIIFTCLYQIACSQPQKLTILHTNDIHASFTPHEAFWIKSDPKPMVGGVEELKFVMDSIRALRTNVLALNAGDDQTGNPISEMVYGDAYGGGVETMLNFMGYDAWEPGNHDLDISQDNLRHLIAVAKYPALCANLTDSSGAYVLNTKPYIILNKKGIRIGIIGIILDDLFHVTNTNNLKGLMVLNTVQTTQRFIDTLKSQSDLIIALTHEGVDEDSILAANTHGLNIIIGAHSHTRLKIPEYINGVIIAQAGSNCENLGLIDLEIENGKVTKYNGQLVQLWKHAKLPENDLSKLVDDFQSKIDKEYGVVVGSLNEDWLKSNNESKIGNFVADALRLSGKADVGITNSSGIRKDLLKGDVKKLDLFEVGPFRNYVCTFPLSGKDLRAMILKYVTGLANNKSNLQYAGVQCSYTYKDSVVTMQTLKIGGVDLDDSKTYTVSTTDFILDQADKYLGYIPAGATYTKTTMLQSMLDKVATEKVLKSPVPLFTKAN